MGIYKKLTYAEYVALGGLRVGSLLGMKRSPKHYRHALANSKQSDALRLGKALHTAVLEPQHWDRDIAIWTGERRTKAGKAAYASFQLASLTKTELTENERDTTKAMAEAVKADPIASHYLDLPGMTEVSITAEDRQTGRLLQCRPDHLAPGKAIIDLKKSRDPAPWVFGRDAPKFGYHSRAAFYQDVVYEATGERLPYVFVTVEGVPPYDVVVFNTVQSPEVMHAGRDEYRELLNKLIDCERTGEWPGIGGGNELDLTLPAYALGDDEIIIEGEAVLV
jgi:PDDEXK-like domain of unknown function (DUF3799)